MGWFEDTKQQQWEAMRADVGRPPFHVEKAQGLGGDNFFDKTRRGGAVPGLDDYFRQKMTDVGYTDVRREKARELGGANIPSRNRQSEVTTQLDPERKKGAVKVAPSDGVQTSNLSQPKNDAMTQQDAKDLRTLVLGETIAGIVVAVIVAVLLTEQK